ncbi:MAG: hypothetical protein K2X48_09395 [Chitinophagaceae bacterium]|nr:hypothetical protein [Chitinophagaceae bacterium]
MNNNNNRFIHFLKLFFSARVFIFIVLGAAVIFLTFFTHNNALEIRISGIASVFIGIGVNNFTAHETRQRDMEQRKYRSCTLLKTLALAENKIIQTKKEIEQGLYNKSLISIDEAEKLIVLNKHLVHEYSAAIKD